MGDPRVSGSTPVYTGSNPGTIDDRMLDILNNPRMNEYTKVAQLEKAVENLPQSEKDALFERLKDRKSHDPLAQKFHYWLSHHPYKAGAVSTVDQVLNTLKPDAQKSAAPAPDPRSSGNVQTPK